MQNSEENRQSKVKVILKRCFRRTKLATFDLSLFICEHILLLYIYSYIILEARGGGWYVMSPTLPSLTIFNQKYHQTKAGERLKLQNRL